MKNHLPPPFLAFPPWFAKKMFAFASAHLRVPWTGTLSVTPKQTMIEASFPNMSRQTMPQTLHASISGSRTRIRNSNTFGANPLTLQYVPLAQPLLNSHRIETFSTKAATWTG
jgi:hypothetical protein